MLLMKVAALARWRPTDGEFSSLVHHSDAERLRAAR